VRCYYNGDDGGSRRSEDGLCDEGEEKPSPPGC